MGCVAVKVNITIYEGGTFDQMFQWSTGSPAVVVNLTGYTAALSVRSKLVDTTALIYCSTAVSPWVADGDSGIYIDTPTTGEYRIYITDEDTTGICVLHKDVEGVYDLFLHNPAGEVVLKQYGKAALKAAVTR